MMPKDQYKDGVTESVSANQVTELTIVESNSTKQTKKIHTTLEMDSPELYLALLKFFETKNTLFCLSCKTLAWSALQSKRSFIDHLQNLGKRKSL